MVLHLWASADALRHYLSRHVIPAILAFPSLGRDDSRQRVQPKWIFDTLSFLSSPSVVAAPIWEAFRALRRLAETVYSVLPQQALP